MKKMTISRSILKTQISTFIHKNICHNKSLKFKLLTVYTNLSKIQENIVIEKLNTQKNVSLPFNIT